MVKKQAWVFIIPFLAVIADQVSKYAVLNHVGTGSSITLIPGILYLTRTSNTGTVFGLFSGMNLLFVAVVIAAMVFVAVYFFKSKDIQLKTILAFVFGAAAGNLIDRVMYGSVIDFLRLSFWPFVFNVADSIVTVCIAWLAVYFTAKEMKDKKKIKKK